MKWRTDEPKEEVIVAQLCADFCCGKERYALLYLATKPYKHYHEDGEEVPYSAIERWASLEDEEPVSEEFEEQVKALWKEVNTGHTYSIIGSYNIFYGVCLDIADWQKEQDKETIELAEDHAMLAGMEKMKEEMIAKAIDVEVHVDAGGYPYISQMELYDYDKDIPLAKEGDKYKVVLIKEN